MNFKELSQEEIRHLLDVKDEQGNLVHQNLLSQHISLEQTRIAAATCPTCHKNGFDVFVDPKQPFSGGSPLPKKRLRCLGCHTEFDP